MSNSSKTGIKLCLYVKQDTYIVQRVCTAGTVSIFYKNVMLTFCIINSKQELSEIIFRRDKMNSSTSYNICNMGLKFEICYTGAIVHSPSLSYIKSHIAICVVNTLLSLAGTILNSLVLYIFWISPQRRSKMSYFPIMMMCTADLGVVTIVQPVFISFIINEILETSNCLHLMAVMFLTLLFSGISSSILWAISIQRYFSIVRPLRHHTIATKQRFLLTSLFIWFIYLVTYLPRILAVDNSWIATAVLLFTFFSTCFLLYLFIFLVARKRIPKANRVTNTSDQYNSRNLVSLLRELKVAKTFIMITLLLLVCYIPYSIVLLKRKLESTTNEWIVGGIAWTVTLLYVNSTLNCCVFFWANRELRKESINIFRKCFGERYFWRYTVVKSTQHAQTLTFCQKNSGETPVVLIIITTIYILKTRININIVFWSEIIHAHQTYIYIYILPTLDVIMQFLL